MKEKRKSKAIYIIGFLASIFFAAFVLMEFREDYWAVAGAGIVMLIQAYFLVNKIEEEIYEKHVIDTDDLDQKLDEVSEKCDKIEQMQKAIYVASKKGTESIENKIEDVKNQVQKIEESNQKSI